MSYILSSFYYANLEDAQLQFLRKEEVGTAMEDVEMESDEKMQSAPAAVGG